MTQWTSKTWPSQPFPNGLAAELDRRVVPVHVTQLYRQISPAGLVQHRLKFAERFPGGLVQVDVHAGVDATPGDVQQAVVAGVYLHGHGLQAPGVEQLLFGHPCQALIGRAVLVLLAKLGIGLYDANDLVVAAELAKGTHFPRRMLVAGADLPDLHPLCGRFRGEYVRYEPVPGRNGRARAGGSG